METDRTESEVVVIGGGPAGLTAAITLARAGVRCLLLERRTEPLRLPRATLVSVRSMELFRSWGLESAILAGADDVTLAMAFAPTLADLDRYEIVLAGVPSREQAAVLSPTAAACVPQDHLERVLLDHLRTLRDAEVWSGVEATLDAHDAAGARVTVHDPATRMSRSVSARYVVAADGVHGVIRRALGIGSVASGSLAERLGVVIHAPLWDVVRDRRYVLYAPTASPVNGAFLPGGEGDRWFYACDWDPATESLADYTPERVVDMVRTDVGTTDIDLDVVVERMGAFQFAAEIADRFRSGRVFLVGDAAHRVTPRGGTGMNMAIASAHNLAWKLAWVLAGRADDELLDTYEAERRPVAEHNLARSIDPDGSRRPVLDEVRVDLGGRIPHAWHQTQDGHRVSTLDLVGDGLTLFTGVADQAWRVAATEVGRALAVALRVERLDVAAAIGLGIGTHGAVLVRPDAVPLWSTTSAGDAAGQLRSTIEATMSPARPREYITPMG